MAARRPPHNGRVTIRVRRPLILLVAVAVVVAVGGAAAGAAWWRWDTGRQPTVRDAVAAMDRAVADAVVAAGPGAAVALSGVVRSTGCRINFLHSGGAFTANADLYTDAGTEDSLIGGIAQRLSGAYTVTRGPAVAGIRPLLADLAGGVQLAVRSLGGGWLQVSARTGCSLGTQAPQVTPSDAGAATAGITALFGRLGTRPASFSEHRLDCRSGAIVTVAAVSEPVDSAGLSERLAAAVPAGVQPFTAGRSNRLAYRDGDVSVIVAASDDGTAVTSQYTTTCAR